MDKKEAFSVRLFNLVKEYIESTNNTHITSELDVQENYFAPSKYNLQRFQGKAISHIDKIEKYFNADFLGGSNSALAKDVENAEQLKLLSDNDKMAIRSIIRSAVEHSKLRGSSLKKSKK